ncbi:MAG: efflux RND transporter periplasmic adaptor subunit [Candidatus Saganbacteria bacterium]|nr:efflux RND transporter periplasmic adaptor subunit [Candidatus Saganbacteria bacterium]
MKIQKLDYKMIVLIVVFIFIPLILSSCGKKAEQAAQVVKVKIGNIKAQIPVDGTVEPFNRLEIKPPVAGRIEQVLVEEGRSVKKGQIVAWMSSSDRAALLDAARAVSKEEEKKWEDVYKPTPIVAPLNGFIIHRGVQPGQTVTLSDAVLVMADTLIVKAGVDETDLSNISLGQNAVIALDAYPDRSIDGRVNQIAYESEVVNNVNVYEVDVLPLRIPSFFRAGMSATINFILSQKNNVMVLPINSIVTLGTQSYVFIPQKGGTQSVQIKTGLANTENIEVVSGVSVNDEVVVPTSAMIEQLRSGSSRGRGIMNPFQKRQTQ